MNFHSFTYRCGSDHRVTVSVLHESTTVLQQNPFIFVYFSRYVITSLIHEIFTCGHRDERKKDEERIVKRGIIL